jgi:hypothetical protein
MGVCWRMLRMGWDLGMWFTDVFTRVQMSKGIITFFEFWRHQHTNLFYYSVGFTRMRATFELTHTFWNFPISGIEIYHTAFWWQVQSLSQACIFQNICHYMMITGTIIKLYTETSVSTVYSKNIFENPVLKILLDIRYHLSLYILLVTSSAM